MPTTQPHPWISKSGRPYTARVRSPACARCGATPDAPVHLRAALTAADPAPAGASGDALRRLGKPRELPQTYTVLDPVTGRVRLNADGSAYREHYATYLVGQDDIAAIEAALRAAPATPLSVLPPTTPIEGLTVADLLTPEAKAELDAGLRQMARERRVGAASASRIPLAGAAPATSLEPLDVERLARAIRRDDHPNDPALWDDPHDPFSRAKAARLLEYAARDGLEDA